MFLNLRVKTQQQMWKIYNGSRNFFPINSDGYSIAAIKDKGYILPTKNKNLQNLLHLEHFKILFFGRRQEILGKMD